MKTHTIFKTIEIGGNNEDVLKKLKKYKLSDYAKELLEKIPWQKEKDSIDLVVIKVSDWFKKYPTTTELFARAKEEGLELCPAEVGPYLRINYDDQPLGEWLYVAHESITSFNGYPLVFKLVSYGDGLWLSNNWAEPGDGWYPDYEFVFRLRKSTLNSEHQALENGNLEILTLRIKNLEEKFRKIGEMLLDNE